MTEPTDDDVIELAAALEMHRALHIVAEVAGLPVGGKDAAMPTPFQAGYQLACEEIAERIRTQQVVVPGGMVLPACGTLPSITQPATGPLRRGVTGVCSKKDGKFGCTCEREGLGDQCIWLRPNDAELERRTGEPHIDGYPLHSGLPVPA